jgi:flagellar protein FliO/FliZ
MNLKACGLALFPAAMPAWAAPPTGVPPLSGGVDLVRWLGALALVLALIFLSAWLVRRVGGMSRLAPGQFQVLAAASLGARERAVLLQVGSKQLVLGVAPGRVETLCVLEGADVVPIEPAAPEPLQPFARKLAEALSRKPGGGG